MILNTLSKLLKDSTAYGVPKIFKRDKLFLKIYWLIFVLLGTSASSYYTFATIINYFKYDVVTKIESVYEQPMLFPTITFCSDQNGYQLIPYFDYFYFAGNHFGKNWENYLESFNAGSGIGLFLTFKLFKLKFKLQF
jgi:hypothetical protein